MSEHKEDQPKLKRQNISLDVKMQMLDPLEKGECQVDIGADLKLPTSTIHAIINNKEKIKSLATTSTTSSVKKIIWSRCYALEKMEKHLSIWIDDEIERNMPFSQAIITEKARSIYSHIQSQTPDVTGSFTVSRGWFDHFKNRNNLYNIKIMGEAVSADTEDAAAFTATGIQR
ncbi:tigger transposable element-derived protein 1-like [Discoglossus pictus]